MSIMLIHPAGSYTTRAKTFSEDSKHISTVSAEVLMETAIKTFKFPETGSQNNR